jgi:hypothetical protein
MKNLAGATRRVFLAALWCMGITGSLLLFAQRPAYAFCESCFCEQAAHAMIRAEVQSQTQKTEVYIAQQMQIHRQQFIVEWYFKQHILAAMQYMSEQLTGASMHQMMIIGSYFDAKEQMERLRNFEEMRAAAFKNFTPSLGVCEIGTMVRSLADAHRASEVNALVISQRQEQRGRNIGGLATADGKAADINARIRQFSDRFCDIRESNNGLGTICVGKNPNPNANNPGKSSPDHALWDKDVDYARVIDNPSNIMVNFANPGGAVLNAKGNDFGDSEAQNETDVMALSNNLFGTDPFGFLSDTMFTEEREENRPIYLETRGILAKRSVAENSFNAIVGMKSQAENADDNAEVRKTAGYMKVIYKELGVDKDTDQQALMTDAPSYYAQMEMLTKKLYERPEFYTNLYDKPANIDRKEVALRAIGLMQHMDMFKSQLRSEATLSVILETGLVEEQRALNDRIRAVKPEGKLRAAP